MRRCALPYTKRYTEKAILLAGIEIAKREILAETNR
jgi:hypothetical protein